MAHQPRLTDELYEIERGTAAGPHDESSVPVLGRGVAATPGVSRVLNDRATIKALLRHGPLTAAEVKALTNVSKPTVYQSLMRLESKGIVIRTGTSSDKTRRSGRHADVFQVLSQTLHVAGVHLTPLQVTVSIADVMGHRLTGHTMDMRDRSAEAAVSTTSTAVKEACAEAGMTLPDVSHVVLGVPAVVTPRANRLELTAGLIGWEEPDFPEALARELGAEVTLGNDVNLAALAEYRWGAGGSSTFLTVWIDEGVGMAVVTEGRLFQGAHGRAGEIDRIPVASTSSRGGLARFFETVDDFTLTQLARQHGIRASSGLEALESAMPREPDADNAGFIQEYARRIATGLAVPASLLDPEAIILCGELLKAGGNRLCSLVARELALLVAQPPKVLLSAVEGDAVVAGALDAAVERAQLALLKSVDMDGLLGPHATG